MYKFFGVKSPIDLRLSLQDVLDCNGAKKNQFVVYTTTMDHYSQKKSPVTYYFDKTKESARKREVYRERNDLR